MTVHQVQEKLLTSCDFELATIMSDKRCLNILPSKAQVTEVYNTSVPCYIYCCVFCSFLIDPPPSLPILSESN